MHANIRLGQKCLPVTGILTVAKSFKRWVFSFVSSSKCFKLKPNHRLYLHLSQIGSLEGFQ